MTTSYSIDMNERASGERFVTVTRLIRTADDVEFKEVTSFEATDMQSAVKRAVADVRNIRKLGML